MSIVIVEQKDEDVLIYADEHIAIRLYDYLYNELEQAILEEDKVNTSLITIRLNDAEFISRRILEEFHGSLVREDNLFRITIGNQDR